MDDSSSPQSPTGRQVLLPAASLNRRMGLMAEGLAQKFILQMRTPKPRESAGLPALSGAGSWRYLGKPERTCNPSTFWLTRKRRRPTRSSCTSAMWVCVGRALSKVVSNLGARPRSSIVQTPWGPLKAAGGERHGEFSIQGDRGTEKETER